MRADDEATQRYVECMLRWMNRDLSFKIPGGVTGNTFLDTYSAALTSRSGAAGTRSGRRGHPRSVHARFSCASCRVWG